MTKQFTIYQGSVFNQPVKFNKTGFDFSDMVVKCQLRRKPESTDVIYEFTITPTQTSMGVLEFNLIMPKEDSAILPIGVFHADFKVSRVSPSYGPLIMCPFSVIVQKPYTRS